MSVAIIDYGSGNLRSAAKAFERARYGEFRVDANGKALLVGMADENLAPLGP